MKEADILEETAAVTCHEEQIYRHVAHTVYCYSVQTVYRQVAHTVYCHMAQTIYRHVAQAIYRHVAHTVYCYAAKTVICHVAQTLNVNELTVRLALLTDSRGPTCPSSRTCPVTRLAGQAHHR